MKTGRKVSLHLLVTKSKTFRLRTLRAEENNQKSVMWDEKIKLVPIEHLQEAARFWACLSSSKFHIQLQTNKPHTLFSAD